MGNCQAAELSAVVIQHPGGKIERLYWPTTAEEVMKSNPGHHVALVTLCIAQEVEEKQQQQQQAESGGAGGVGHVRFTRVRLLKPKDILMIGQDYRLITSQEVSKAVRARKLEKIKRAHSELINKQRQLLQNSIGVGDQRIEVGQRAVQVESERRRTDQGEKLERDRQKRAAGSGARARHWRPKLQSISEGVN